MAADECGRRILIMDTTLRDGEQFPGASLSQGEKLELAKQIARLGVDVIEAGFPISSPGDFAAVRAIAELSRTWDQDPVIAGLARAIPADIDACWRAVGAARRPRVHTFIHTSPAQMAYQMRREPAEVLSLAVAAVAHAKGYCADVEFSAEDAPRSDVGFLKEICLAAVEAGATTINIPDTLGYSLPGEFGRMVAAVAAAVPPGIAISVHAHDDLGLATAVSLAAIEAGATQVECTVGGIGGRAGNASLEEIVMILHTRRGSLPYYCGVQTNEIYRTSRLVSVLTGMVVPPNKAVTGADALAGEAGLHKDAPPGSQQAFEVMGRESIGRPRSRMVLDKRSGNHALRGSLKELGIHLDEQRLKVAFAQFRELADRKGEVTDEDLEAIVGGAIVSVPETFVLEDFAIGTGNKTTPTATVRLGLASGGQIEESATGDGPVDAMYHAVDRITAVPVTLIDYSLNAATSGKDALGEVTVKLEYKGHVYSGRGVSTDVLEASLRAYIHALNKIMASGGRASTAPPGAGTPAEAPGKSG